MKKTIVRTITNEDLQNLVMDTALHMKVNKDILNHSFDELEKVYIAAAENRRRCQHSTVKRMMNDARREYINHLNHLLSELENKILNVGTDEVQYR